MRTGTGGPAARSLPATTARRLAQQAETRSLAAEHDSVLTRQQLRALGVTRWDLRREFAAGRWVPAGRHCVVLHTGTLDIRAQWRIALADIDAHSALDGVTGLVAAGLQNMRTMPIHVSIPRGARPGQHPGVVVHETRRRRDSDVLTQDIRRVRPSIAAVRAALWAPTDRQAALYLVMPVQQRLTTAAEIAAVVATILRDRRRQLLRLVVADILDGAQALGELDFGRLCRRYGVPRPTRQVVRLGPRGRAYLDVYWADCDLAAEIEGIHHGEAWTQVDDARRHNAVTAMGTRLLRIPLLGLRTDPGTFLGQVLDTRRRLLGG